MKTAHRNLVPTTLAAFALAAVLAGSASAARTSAPLDWPERWAAAHVAANGSAESLRTAKAHAVAAALPDWPERWAAAHPGSVGFARTLLA